MKILVMSCDNNVDLFPIYKHCIEKYWPNHPEIFYSTETIVNPNYKTICKNFTINKWTARVRESVKEIDDDFILLMCDDIFIREKVNDELIKSLPQYFDSNTAAINFENHFDNNDIDFNNILKTRHKNAKYRTSMMIQLWKKDKLLKVLDNIEVDPWKFEKLNNHLNYKYLINSNYHQGLINFGKVDNIYNWGLVRGKWALECSKFLIKEGLDIDFTKRGFVEVDLVVPYVDSCDKEWQALFEKYNENNEIKAELNSKNRFRGQGDFFRFFFRAIDTNLKWINRVFLIVQSHSQVPKWLNTTKVKVVTHDEFIPKKYLPTFNSCTLEMFLHKIPDLSEEFLYLNDDFFILNKKTKNDFFENGKIKQNFTDSKVSGVYGKHCSNCFELIYSKTNESFVRLDHEIRAYYKSKMAECFKKHSKAITNSITTFRNDKNFNCYIYSLYLRKLNLVTNSNIESSCISKYDVGKLKNISVACINDIDENENIYENKEIKNWFLNKFATKSQYELNDCFNKNVDNSKNIKSQDIKDRLSDSALPTFEDCIFW